MHLALCHDSARLLREEPDSFLLYTHEEIALLVHRSVFSHWLSWIQLLKFGQLNGLFEEPSALFKGNIFVVAGSQSASANCGLEMDQKFMLVSEPSY